MIPQIHHRGGAHAGRPLGSGRGKSKSSLQSHVQRAAQVPAPSLDSSVQLSSAADVQIAEPGELSLGAPLTAQRGADGVSSSINIKYAAQAAGGAAEAKGTAYNINDLKDPEVLEFIKLSVLRMRLPLTRIVLNSQRNSRLHRD